MSNMNMLYIAPNMSVIEIDIQGCLLVDSSTEGLRIYDDETTEEQI